MIMPLNLITIPLYMTSIAIDITMFFLLVRILTTLKKFDLLAAFDNTGKSLVNLVAGKTSYLWNKFFDKRLSENGRLFMAMTVLAVLKIVITGILKQCS